MPIDPRLQIYAVQHSDCLGFVEGVSNDKYHSSSGVSKSSLDKIHKSLNHWLQSEYVSKPHLTFGSGTHAAVMEPALFTKEFEAAPKMNKNSAAWKKMVAEAAGRGVTLVDQDVYDTILTARDAVMEHPVAGEYFSRTDAIAEGSLWVEEPNTGILVRVRPDWLILNDRLVVDLKTTKDASPGDPGGGGGFPRSIGQWRYDVQDVLYSDMLEAHFGHPFEFLFCAVDSDPPHGVAMYQIDEDSRRNARFQYMSDLAKLIDYVENGTNNGGYPSDVQTVTVPKYFKRG